MKIQGMPNLVGLEVQPVGMPDSDLFYDPSKWRVARMVPIGFGASPQIVVMPVSRLARMTLLMRASYEIALLHDHHQMCVKTGNDELFGAGAAQGKIYGINPDDGDYMILYYEVSQGR